MLGFLTPPHSFAELAEALSALGLQLEGVRACTFPSRPEPASARFVDALHTAVAYSYEPDDDLRWILVLSSGALLDVIQEATRHMTVSALDALAAPLSHEGSDHLDIRRAACALRVVARRDAERSRRLLALDALAASLHTGRDVCARRAAAEQLANHPSSHTRRALERALDDPDLEVRFHCRRALDAMLR